MGISDIVYAAADIAYFAIHNVGHLVHLLVG